MYLLRMLYVIALYIGLGLVLLMGAILSPVYVVMKGREEIRNWKTRRAPVHDTELIHWN